MEFHVHVIVYVQHHMNHRDDSARVGSGGCVPVARRRYRASALAGALFHDAILCRVLLTCLTCVRCQAAFHAAQVDGRALLGLTEKDLEEQLCVVRKVDRDMILRELEGIKRRG